MGDVRIGLGIQPAQAEILEVLADRVGHGLMVVDPSGTVVAANAEMRRLLGVLHVDERGLPTDRDGLADASHPQRHANRHPFCIRRAASAPDRWPASASRQCPSLATRLYVSSAS